MRNAENIPAPLVIEQAQVLSTEPLSTTAKFEEYMQNRANALKISPKEFRKIPDDEREKKVYQYLTPEEIWLLKDAMKKSPVEEIHMDGVNLTEKRVTLEDFISHELKRHEYKAFSDEELKSKPMSEIEYYYQFLTPDEILEQDEKLNRLRN